LNYQIKMTRPKAKLILEDGSVFEGYSFGYETPVSGEVVFNTAMTGYPESLTDPSYKGQILVSTYPLVGNYGVPEFLNKNGLIENFESEKIQVTAFIISGYSFDYSHWSAKKSLSDWLIENGVPGLYGIDTRALTVKLREKGTMLGKIIFNGEDIPFYDPNSENLVRLVSVNEKTIHGKGKYKIVLVDLGVKHNIVRCLIKRNTTVIRVPWDYDFSNDDYDGLVISNGPGDPAKCKSTIENVKKAFDSEKPVFGICMGNQIMSLAAGAETYKLTYGHRSHNQPVMNTENKKCYITSQNHGYAVDTGKLDKDWKEYFINLNDGTCEGIKHRSKPFFATQFHPEASSGPTDTEFLFDEFLSLIQK